MNKKERQVVEEVLYATRQHRKTLHRILRKGTVKDDVLFGMAISADKLQSLLDGKPLANAIAC
jgi:hypothetical protein